MNCAHVRQQSVNIMHSVSLTCHSPSLSFSSGLPTPYPLENTDIFNVSIDLPFPQYHLLGIIHKLLKLAFFTSIQFSSVAQSCLTFCDPMNCSTPGLPVHHQLPEFTQTHVHRFSDAIQPSHSLSSPSPPAPNSSQCQSLFQ